MSHFFSVLMSWLFCFYSILSNAQEIHYNQRIGADLLRNDFMLLRDTLQKSHSGLYRYRTKAEMDHIFDSCYATIRQSETELGFFTKVAYIIASLGDGHTNCSLPKSAMNAFIDQEKFFPELPIFIHSRAFVYCSNQDTLLRGTELLYINSIPMTSILQNIYQYVQSDGFIVSHKDNELDNFILLYYMIYGPADHFDITYRSKQGTIQRTTLKADQFKNILCPAPFSRPTKYLELHYVKGNIAVLSIKSFFDGFMEQTGENFASFLDSAFADIKKKNVNKLLIDIRRNQGGNDQNGELLYSYLTSKPFRYYLSQNTTTENFSDKDHPNLSIQQPKKNNYSGKLFVLADGRSFSASAEFSAIIKSNSRGLFLGDMCGGGYYGNTSGEDIHVILPATQIDVRLPLVKYTMAVRPLGDNVWGIEPDFPLYPSIYDLIEQKDRVLGQAIDIVRVN